MRGLFLLFGLIQIGFFQTCRKCPPQHLERGCSDIPHFNFNDSNPNFCGWNLTLMDPVDYKKLTSRCEKAIIYRTKNAFNEDVLRFHCNNTSDRTRWTSIGMKFPRLAPFYQSRGAYIANDEEYLTELCLKCVNGKWLADSYHPDGSVFPPGLNVEVLGAHCFYVDWLENVQVMLSASPDREDLVPPTIANVE